MRCVLASLLLSVGLLAGGVDPWTLHRWRTRKAEFIAMETDHGRTVEEAEASFDEMLTKAEALIARQAAFAERHGVRPAVRPSAALNRSATVPPRGLLR